MRLQKISRLTKDPVKLQCDRGVDVRSQHQTVKDITSLLRVDADYVRGVIHAFNEHGPEALNPKWSGGRPRACLLFADTVMNNNRAEEYATEEGG
ncbi:helix-turn-helix domain-containing protein, partial [Rhodococcus sp. T7]|uniref:helix-turn-helix domain-containing protein n=1 Tax=Rhodococcus sp. T7 TaxID=627444 RepID=UPI001357EA43